MSDTAVLESSILKFFAFPNKNSLPAKGFREKFGDSTSRTPKIKADPAKVDEAITALIDSGLLTEDQNKKSGLHPRTGGSYKLTSKGKDQVKPQKPDVPDELLAYQQSFVLLQLIRFPERSASRTDLNKKFESSSARVNLEFPGIDPKAIKEKQVDAEEIKEASARFKETINYHLHELLAKGSLEEKRDGNKVIYSLTAEGLKALGAANQHETVEFRFLGSALNFLLQLARDSTSEHGSREFIPAEPAHVPSPTTPDPTPPHSAEVTPEEIHAFIAQLQADKYAGRDQIPVHEVRALVARHHGEHAASHPVFDKLLKRMRSEGDLEISAIADSRQTPVEHLNDSIPGMNETLFFIDTQ